MFLRPTIVRGKEDLAEVTAERYNGVARPQRAGKGNSLLLPADARQLFEGETLTCASRNRSASEPWAQADACQLLPFGFARRFGVLL